MTYVTPCFVCGYIMTLPPSQVTHECLRCGGKHALCAEHLYASEPTIVSAKLRVCPNAARTLAMLEAAK